MTSGLIACCIVAMVATGAFADNKWGITYDISIPDGGTRDYIEATSWRGVGLQWRWQTQNERPFTTGISIAWHVFSQRFDGTMLIENGAINGVQDRYLNSFPLMVTAYYYIGGEDGVQTYLGGGAGTMYVIQRAHLGINVLEETGWHLAVAPEVGIYVPINDIRGLLSVKYDYAFEAGEYIGGDKRDWQYWVVSLGLMYSYW